jgi:hypothetical protein
MTPPSPGSQVRRMAALAGTAPDLTLDHDVLMVGMIAQAKERGVTWAQIGSVLVGRADGKLAKKAARTLARDANRRLLAAGKPAAIPADADW